MKTNPLICTVCRNVRAGLTLPFARFPRPSGAMTDMQILDTAFHGIHVHGLTYDEARKVRDALRAPQVASKTVAAIDAKLAIAKARIEERRLEEESDAIAEANRHSRASDKWRALSTRTEANA